MSKHLSRRIAVGLLIVLGLPLLGAERKPQRSLFAIADRAALLRMRRHIAQQAIGALAQEVGTIRGRVLDKDFDVPLAAAQVTIVETGQRAESTDEGSYSFSDVKPGAYTLVFAKDGYVRQVNSGVTVTAGQLTQIDASLSGDFTDIDEVLVQDVAIGGSETDLIKLRLDAPQLMDFIGADLMSKAGASDVASALNLVAGATVQDGKYAVIRGLPDRYVSSQMNGVRLPTADEDKRAVELDQFPTAVVESVQVSKTFTPDQQGDASGGAVNVLLKNIPDHIIFEFKSQVSYNSQVTGRRDFLTYEGGGVNTWGRDTRDIQFDKLGENWDEAVGVSRGEAPTDYKWSLAAGGKHEFDGGLKIGGFASFFYERDSYFFDDGVDNSYWVRTPGEGLVPRTIQGTPEDGDFKTALFDVTQGQESVQWGRLGTFGMEWQGQKVGVTYLYTRTAEDIATLAEDTRGKEFFFPGYDPNDSMAIGNTVGNRRAAPYIRTETLQYTERTTTTLQFHGEHVIPFQDFGSEDFIVFTKPVFDWTVSNSDATFYEPDKRQFGSIWLAPSFDPGLPFFGIPPTTLPAIHLPFKPAANFLLGNAQRIWKEIDEESEQYALNLKFPFEQWSDSPGYIKMGLFDDQVTRQFNQDSFSNFDDNDANYQADFDEFWSGVFPTQVDDPTTVGINEGHPITDGPPFIDVDYRGNQNISAWYLMADVPLTSYVNVIGGARWEDTEIGIINFPEEDATWFPAGALTDIALEPGDADVDFQQSDILPSIGLVVKPLKDVTVRASYSETVARQTFKELTPILQQEFLGGDIFIGNPDLRMSAVDNYDLRLDFTPTANSLFSFSKFRKDVVDAIEYVQRVSPGFTFTTPVNYPEGEIEGFEVEARQGLGDFWEPLQGFSLGANGTVIDSEVTLPPLEAAAFELPNIAAPMATRDMTNAPEYLYNLYFTYDAPTNTQFALFYSFRGDALVAGAGESNGNFVPNVYALGYGTLNLNISQKLGKHLKLQFQAKNLTNPSIEEVYRSDFIGDDVTKTSYTKGIEYSIGLSAEFTF